MRFVIQRVSKASVSVGGEVIGAIDRGYMVLIGVSETDTEQDADKLIAKMLKLRIFEDAEGKTNLDLMTVGGNLLMISQFTLYADLKKGNRPSFVHAGSPEKARQLYEYILERCRNFRPDIQHGIFGEHMEVSLINDGPFTILLDSESI